MADRDKKIVVIGGPTATGKTALSLGLAKEFGGEIISADSMQIYRGLDIGTAKATAAEQAAASHHLVDILDPSQRYSAADFVKQAAGCPGQTAHHHRRHRAVYRKPHQRGAVHRAAL